MSPKGISQIHTSRLLRMGGNQDFVAVEFRVGNVVVDVREMRLARRQVRGRFQV
ncbi:hypothetical protein LUZ85_02210 [Neisseria gonorrhoeae]|nr:hypothetical protein [Neisseria gonorrhoeae]MCF2999757.1 hypothetical protein [Neisseria gonorrhoeae]MCF3002339.1 hypothetical protein [Neisseria gonorrhoeae]MCF3013837.1 hypothetical protein [Neisseria gonorrhoeae]MCF3017650.1 hypothetical protein [Neisseria gonorrhoeae]